jgi:nicotinate-nucleotide adenylyltransferase
MRIGVFGGSFDPPHAAHAALARAAQQQLGLDLVLWVPTFSPPHKSVPMTQFEDRLAMTRALTSVLNNERATPRDETAGSPTMDVTDVEATLSPPSYTLHTLQALKEKFGDAPEWYLIVGADNWANFPRWYQPESVLAAATPVVYPRAGYSTTDFHPRNDSTEPRPEPILLNFPEMPEQSTNFRTWLLRDRKGALAALPESVATVIRERNLYAGSRAESGTGF